jgi:hypothetical protein
VLKSSLRVDDINLVLNAHIHCAPAGSNGSVGVDLYRVGPGGAGPGYIEGTLAKGKILMLNEGNACGWVTMYDVVATVQSGDAYIDVHTRTFPGGKLCGQVA